MIRFASSQKLWDADVRDDTLGNGLSESVKLRDVTTTLHSETDVDVGKLLGSNNEDGLVDLVSEESAKQLVSVYTDYSLAPRFRPTWHPSFLPQCLNILPQPASPQDAERSSSEVLITFPMISFISFDSCPLFLPFVHCEDLNWI
jgi:hypothetical protein